MSRTVRSSLFHRVATTLIGPVIGALLGLVTGLLFELAVSTPWLSFNGLFGFGEYVGEPIMLAIATLAGALGGTVFSITMLSEALRMTISPKEIEIAWDDARVQVPAELVRSIVVDRDIVILGDHDIELARVRNDVDSAHLVDALLDCGYTSIINGDPFDYEFRSEEDCTLCNDVKKLLSARAHAIRAGAHGDAELLRRRLASRGVMVRDLHRRGLRPVGQQWRAVDADFRELAVVA